MLTVPDWLAEPAGQSLRTVLTFGVFDGLHLGHQFLVERVIRLAREKRCSSLVLTFDPHPLSVLSPSAAPEVLTTFGQKAEILSAMGLDALGCLVFDETLSDTGPAEFLEMAVTRRTEALAIVTGPDFRFGRGAEGHFGLLSSWARARGIAVEACRDQTAPGGEDLSSSHLRGLLKVGHVEAAAKILGRPYRLDGEVVPGQRRGRTLGFPTANLGQILQLIPGPGVYAVRALFRGESRPAMTSIGHNPTFRGGSLTVETFVFDFHEEFYGERLGLEFIRRIRDMIRFDSAQSLAEQLRRDEAKARSCLAPAPSRQDSRRGGASCGGRPADRPQTDPDRRSRG
ncbi:MAG: riboflavin biosynthesis protein RibF [Deltaproteobacteria bacterium]|jgi:riboflavin kinase/FMN adenylyltransferase|nr:riboflavin biosynthesis protein RibF [Deltaproteobacteria bacterium]